MRIDAYLFFHGNCEEAFAFYKSALGGELEINRYGGSPISGDIPPGWEAKVMHCTLRTSDVQLMGSDAPDARTAGNTISLSLFAEHESQADSAFAKLSDGGAVTMPMQNTFWGSKFGMLTDRYGINWMVSTRPSEVPAS